MCSRHLSHSPPPVLTDKRSVYHWAWPAHTAAGSGHTAVLGGTQSRRSRVFRQCIMVFGRTHTVLLTAPDTLKPKAAIATQRQGRNAAAFQSKSVQSKANTAGWQVYHQCCTVRLNQAVTPGTLRLLDTESQGAQPAPASKERT